MRKARLFDSYALLAYLKKEKGFQKVKSILSDHEKHNGDLLMNEINVGEVYYILSRERSANDADLFLNTILPALGILLVSNSLHDVIQAATIKAQYSISYADAFVVATAIKYNATIITGDPDFKKAETLIEVEWL